VDDFAATVDHLATHDVRMPVQLPAGFGFSSPSTTAGIQFEWSGFTVPEDPRRGAPTPERAVAPVLEVTNLAFVGAVVTDPVAAARRLATLLDTAVTFERSEAAPGDPLAGVSLGDCTLALFPLDADRSTELWGRRHDRPRVSLLAVRVPDLADACTALRDVDVPLLREGPGLLVLDPSTTADVEVAVVGDLLPGDPRS
jgi:hypothetical protein